MATEKGIVLAASEGKRMRPLTDFLPKPLIRINNKPLVLNSIEQLGRLGVKEVLVNLEPRFGNLIRRVVEAEYSGDVNIKFVFQEERNGIGFAILDCRKLIGDASFFISLPDEFHPNLSKLTRESFLSGDTVLVIRRAEQSKELEENTNIVIDKKSGQVVKVVRPEKKNHASEYHLCGLMTFSPLIFEALDKFKDKKEHFRSGEFSTNESLQYLIDIGVPITYIECNGFYKNINSLEDLSEVYDFVSRDHP